MPIMHIAGHSGTTDGTKQGSTLGTTGAIGELCRQAERAGATALWAVDHLYWPNPMLECLTTLAVAATATSTAAIGTCVLQLPLRSAGAVAKQATALQLLSGDRFVLGVGVGSHRGEYEMAGVDFAERGRTMDLQLTAVRAAWAGDADPGAAYSQRPVSTPVPVWIGGASAPALDRAARSGDGWIPMFLAPTAFGERLQDLRHRVEAAGRPSGAVMPAVVAMVSVGDDGREAERGSRWLSRLYSLPPKAFGRHLIAGSAAQCADAVLGYYAAGAEHVAVMITDDRPLEQFAALTAELTGSTGRPPPGRRPASDLAGTPS